MTDKKGISNSGEKLLEGSVHSFAIRSGRLTSAQSNALKTLSSKYIIPYQSKHVPLDCFFSNPAPIILEIGFGMGHATWRIAQDNPQLNYVGIEVHLPGIGRLIIDIDQHSIMNLKIIAHDAIEVLRTMIPEASLAGIHLFYPDPWPKKRHHKRRLMQDSIVMLMAQKLVQNAYLYFVTDIEEYARFSKDSLDACSLLRNNYESFAPRQEWRPETKFENQAKNSGRSVFELLYLRN